MSYFLLILQGVTELLPLSSSFHILLWTDQGQHTFQTLALHVGSFLGLALRHPTYLGTLLRHPFLSWWSIAQGVCATLPLGCVGLIVAKYPFHFSTPFLACVSVGFSLLLALSLTQPSIHTKATQLSVGKTILWGLGQSGAFISGVSRLGLALTLGRFLGLNPRAAVQWAYITGLWSLGAIALWAVLSSPISLWMDLSLWGNICLLTALTYVLYPWTRALLLSPWGLGILIVYRILLAVGVLYFT